MKYFLILLLSTANAFGGLRLSDAHGLSLFTKTKSSVISTGIVGQVFSDNFSVLTNWVPSNLTLSVNTNTMLVTGSASLAGMAMNTNFETCSENYTIDWTFHDALDNSSQAGVGIGVYGYMNTRSYFGIFTATPGTYQANIYEYTPSTWTLLCTSSGSITNYTNNVYVHCRLTRTPLGWTFACTNLSNGTGVSCSTNTSYNTGSSTGLTPGPQQLGIWCYDGTFLITNLVMTNTMPWPEDDLIVGDSITEGYNALWLTNRYSYLIGTNYPTKKVYNYSGASSTTTNILRGIAEIIAAKPSKVTLMIGGNDIYFNQTLATTTTNYNQIVTNLTAHGITVVNCAPTPRGTVNLLPLCQWICTNYPSSSITNTWKYLLGTGTGLNSSYDSGDTVHPNAAGHNVIFTNIIDRGFLP